MTALGISSRKELVKFIFVKQKENLHGAAPMVFANNGTNISDCKYLFVRFQGFMLYLYSLCRGIYYWM